MALFFSFVVTGWIWWFADGSDRTDDFVNLIISAFVQFLSFITNNKINLAASSSMSSMSLINTNDLFHRFTNLVVPIPGTGSLYYLPPLFGITYSVAIRWSMFICVFMWLVTLLPGFCCLKFRFGESVGRTCSKGMCPSSYPKRTRRCSYFWNFIHFLGSGILFMPLWTIGRHFYFMKYIYMLPQIKYVLLWWIFLTEAMRSFVIVLFIYMQRVSTMLPLHLLLGEFLKFFISFFFNFDLFTWIYGCCGYVLVLLSLLLVLTWYLLLLLTLFRFSLFLSIVSLSGLLISFCLFYTFEILFLFIVFFL